MRIVLIGLSGTGKSTCGERLAQSLEWQFVDTDREVVGRAGKPIHRIFQEDGEAAFRRMEAEVVRLALLGERRVIAMGGGAVMDPKSRELLDGSLVVLLEAGIGTMLDRLSADSGREPRPLVGTEGREGIPSPPSPRERLERMKSERDSVYHSLADAVISTEDVDVRGAVARLEAVARGRLGLPPRDVVSEPRRIHVSAAAGGYDIILGTGLLDRAGEILRREGVDGRIMIVSDETVFAFHGESLLKALSSEGYQTTAFRVRPGEASKSLETASDLYDWLVETSTERRDIVLALGGGVIGDLAGFVAATYLRGLRLLQVPTSLLAQVDSSVGGKVAVNHPRGKNLVGAFYPPSLVLADVQALSTLPHRDLSAAMAEIVKHGVILDEAYFRAVESNDRRLLGLDLDALAPVVARSIELKARVVEDDERESGIRAILNYGHTIGHAVEAVTGYERFRHGEAVAVGMAGAAEVAVGLGMLDRSEADRQNALLERLGLPTKIPNLPVVDLLTAMVHDKKASRGKLTWILPERIGKVSPRRDVPSDLIRQVLISMGGQT